ncbi:MAG: rod shape-determining protein MreD [Spirochaetales bacterium]|jgi:rod shape-determining protein MreD|nr:rod shape-determining protein MreD [Spirochaetales bacterium]
MRLFLALVFTCGFVLLQSTAFMHKLAFSGVVPDLSLIAVIFLANRNGRIMGETAGFAGGLVEDFLSLAPLGFHALVKTLIGFFVGGTCGLVFTGSLFLPMLMTGAATLVKCFLSMLLLMISGGSSASGFFSWATLIEMGYTMLLTPFLFAFLGFFKFLSPGTRG